MQTCALDNTTQTHTYRYTPYHTRFRFASTGQPMASTTSQAGGAQTAEAQVSAFEAAFGSLSAPPAGQQTQTGMDVDADPSRPRWKQLFDAPSHALPPPSALAQAFLRLITAE